MAKKVKTTTKNNPNARKSNTLVRKLPDGQEVELTKQVQVGSKNKMAIRYKKDGKLHFGNKEDSFLA